MKVSLLAPGVQRPEHDLCVAVCSRDLGSSQAQRTLRNLLSQDWPPDSALLLVLNSQQIDVKLDHLQGDFGRAFPSIYLAHEAEPGFASVRNCALDWAQNCESILFLDDDTVVETDWLIHMWHNSRRQPSQVFGSLHIRVEVVPDDQTSIDRVAASFRNSRVPTRSGTNGLLLPMSVVANHRFNPLFNFCGGEDTELLMRLASQGNPVRTAKCIAIEEDRLLSEDWVDDARAAFRQGQLWVAVNRTLGRPTGTLRLRSFIGLIPATTWLLLMSPQDRSKRRRALRLVAVRLGVSFGKVPVSNIWGLHQTSELDRERPC